MFPGTMRPLVIGDLRMLLYKMRTRQLLRAATKAKRLARASLLRRKLRDGMLRNIVFSDEELFTVQDCLNQQNDRVLSRDRQSIQEDHRRVYRTQTPASRWSGLLSVNRAGHHWFLSHRELRSTEMFISGTSWREV